MRCLECAKLKSADKKMTASGLGICPLDDIGEYRSFSRQRQCKDFQAAEAEIVQKRVTWWNGRATKEK